MCPRSQSNIQHDTYIPPYAALELGYTYAEKKDFENAKLWIEKARNEYSGFLVEAFVHLRAHGAMREITDTEEASQGKVNGKNVTNITELTEVPLNEMNELSLIDTSVSSKIKRSNVLSSWMGLI